MPFVLILIGAFILYKGASVTGIIEDDMIKTYDNLFKKYGEQYKIDWKMLKAICMNESNLGQNSRVKNGQVSYDGLSWGIMQLTLTTANDFESTTINSLNNPEFSIRVATKFLSSLSKQFSGDTRSIVMAYNQGAGNQKKFLLAEKEKRMTEEMYPQAKEYWKRYQANYNEVVASQG